MEKEVRKFKLDYKLDWEYGIEIKKLREDLDAIEKLGATHLEIEPGVSYDCPFVDIDAYAERIETDEEFKARINEETKRQEAIKLSELEKLEELKSKYES